MIWQALSLVALAIAAYIGLKFPDVDQRIGFLLHRSIITHGPLLPLLAFVIAEADNPARRRFGIGICAGFAVHMAFDLFPLAWQGYALISVPIYGWLPPVVSWICLAATTLICMGLGAKLIQGLADGLLLLIALAGAFAVAVGNEREFWWPTAVILAALVIACWIVKPTRQGNRQDSQTGKILR